MRENMPSGFNSQTMEAAAKYAANKVKIFGTAWSAPVTAPRVVAQQPQATQSLEQPKTAAPTEVSEPK
jgi:hypothetical protein